MLSILGFSRFIEIWGFPKVLGLLLGFPKSLDFQNFGNLKVSVIPRFPNITQSLRVPGFPGFPKLSEIFGILRFFKNSDFLRSQEIPKMSEILGISRFPEISAF